MACLPYMLPPELRYTFSFSFFPLKCFLDVERVTCMFAALLVTFEKGFPCVHCAILAIVTSQTDLARICATRGEELDELGIVEEYDDDDDDDDDDDGDEHYVYGGLDMFEPATTDEEDANAQVDADDLYYLGVSDDENEEVGSDGGTDDDGGDDAGGDGGRAGPLRWDNLWDDDPPQ
ncbi:hypothetical protein OsI_11449 [Oryza sativa Indica Group]|uniref:Uncharacterized protein n=1 Tax=Oryza sativa subsp. indica TaxID=39946 RepID=A2XGE0_ORYSI|nr:hypothetical protein OsI_11449 [Oryza sativa Indica Group]